MSLEPSYRPARDDVVAPVRVGAAGVAGPTRAQARGHAWRRTSHGFYVPGHVDGEVPEQRIAEASVAIPEVGGITGWAALRWCGGTWFDGTCDGGRERRDVAIVTGYMDVRNQPGITISQEQLSPTELTLHDGLPVTEPCRSVFFEARYAPTLTDAVRAVDLAAYADLITLEEFTAFAFFHRGWTGVEQARRSAVLGSENCWSPMETAVRLRWELELSQPPPLCNMPIFDLSGRHIATPDLLDLDRGLAVEYDGVVHLTTARRSVDIDREMALRDHGLEVVTIVANDFSRVGGVAGKLYRATQHAERTLSHRTPAWTVEQPPGWRPTHTVLQRRAVAAEGLAHLLPNRRRAA